MAYKLCTKPTSIISSSSSSVACSSLPRRLPLVGVFCLLSLGLINLSPSISSSSSSSSFRTKSSNRVVHTSAMADSTSNNIVVYVTVPNKEAGQKLAGSIVKAKLAACVNRVPGVESVYEWKGKIQTDAEELLIIKTRKSLLDALTAHVKANHEYDTPEVIALPIIGGSLEYLEWIKNSTRD